MPIRNTVMSADVPSWPALLEQLLQGQALSATQSTQLMQAWLAEELTPVQTGAFLAGLRAKGVVAEELAAMAAVLRDACPLPCPRPDLLMVDTCGTGGDGADTFNISTAVAFTAAACGVKVAKHGNRSASGKAARPMFWKVWASTSRLRSRRWWMRSPGPASPSSSLPPGIPLW